VGLSSHASITRVPSNPFRTELIRLLQIPVHLTDRSDATLQVAYSRWKAHAQAQQKLSEMVTAGTWPGQKPAAAQLADLFISKTNWFEFYCKAFRKISNFPDMIQWLEDAPDAGTSLVVWGFMKNRYGFADLIAHVTRGGPVVVGDEESGESAVHRLSKNKRKVKEEKGSVKKRGKNVAHVGRKS
jgi:hypothetical protein